MGKRKYDDSTDLEDANIIIVKSFHSDIERMLLQVQKMVRDNESVIDKLNLMVDQLEEVYQKTFPKEFWKLRDEPDSDGDYIEETESEDEFKVIKT